jgi:hypothetical protein
MLKNASIVATTYCRPTVWSVSMDSDGYVAAAARIAAETGVDEWVALMQVFLPRLREIDWPSELQNALDVAERHWAGGPRDLTSARVLVWNFINKTYPSHDELASKHGRAARALLCVFWEERTSEETGDSAEWFAAMIDDEAEWV